jgi:DMSO/TMAO reductase YedYZ molybdopterin-dependent catalytic subunit
MKIKLIGMGALIGALLTAPQIALLYLVNQLAALPFVPFDIFDWMTPLLPGPLITFGIDRMIDLLLLLGLNVADTAKTAEQTTAISMYFTLGVLAGIIFYTLLMMRRVQIDQLTGLVIGSLYGLPMIAISMGRLEGGVHPVVAAVWLITLYLAWGYLFSAAYGRLSADPLPGSAPAEGRESRSVQVLSRRQFLITLGASAATVTVAGAGLSALLAQDERRQQADLDDSMAHQAGETARQAFPNLDDPVTPVPGTRPEYTPVKDHYKVFIRLEPPVIDGTTWRLPVTGLVDNPLMLSLDDIRNNYPAHDQYITLSCISGRVGTTLISTTLWTGASVQDVLADAGVQPEAKFLHIISGDGYYETVSLNLINSDARIMFCYAWDSNALPVDHGFPLRIWIPDRYGMKQPKWITAIEVTDKYDEGYWVRRGWDEVARVKSTSVIDTVAVDAIIHDGNERKVPIGGIAWAGDRGISKVEVRVDGGVWQPAQLRAPLSETTWVIWRYEWPFKAGHHLFQVRCVDGKGTPQIETRSDVRPSGATGIHEYKADL